MITLNLVAFEVIHVIHIRGCNYRRGEYLGLDCSRVGLACFEGAADAVGDKNPIFFENLAEGEYLWIVI